MFTPLEFDLRFIVEPQILPCCGPLFFSRSLETAVGNVTANGSFGLVDTGKKQLLITCHHVWEEFQKMREQDSELRIFVCLDRNAPVVLNLNPIDQDKSLDLATFDLAPLLQACGGRRFYPLNQNPVPRVAKGDQLVFVGYPGSFRTAADGEIGFGRMLYGLYVSDISRLGFAADMSKAVTEYVLKPKPKKHSSQHGGISGTMCFLVQRDRPARLVGFATSEFLNRLWFTHARCLNQDGTLDMQL